MVKREKAKVTEEEMEFRHKSFPDTKGDLNINPVCGACKLSVREYLATGKPLIHPLLEILLCQKCHSFYGDGDFSVDEDGSDKWCRWCGQGGVIYQCSKCPSSFCKKCIKRNLPRNVMDDVTKDGWECFNCNIEPLYGLRAACWAVQKHSAPLIPATKHKRKYSDSDDEYFPSHYPKRVGRSKPSEEDLLYIAASTRFNKTLSDVCSLTDLFKMKICEIRSMKNHSSIESFEKSTAKVHSLFDDLHGDLDNLLTKLNNSNLKLQTDFKQWKTENDQKKVKENGSKKDPESSDETYEKSPKKSLNKSKKKSEAADSEGSNESADEEKSPKKSLNKSKKKSKAADSEGSNEEPERTPKKLLNKSKRSVDFKVPEIEDSDGSNEESEKTPKRKATKPKKLDNLKKTDSGSDEESPSERKTKMDELEGDDDSDKNTLTKNKRGKKSEEPLEVEESDEEVSDKKMKTKSKISKSGSRKRGH